MLPYFSRLWNHIRESYITYVLTKEDIHELTYQQAHKGALKRITFIILGSMFRFTYLIVFLYLTYTNFINLRYNQAFLSLSSSSGECAPVPKIHTFSSLHADVEGYWESELDYSPSKSAYLFSLYDVSLSYPEYKIFMNKMRHALHGMGEEAKIHNLAINLLHWCFWEFNMPEHGEVRMFKFSGAPEYIMNLDQVQGTVSDINHDKCTVGIQSAYELVDTHVILNIAMSAFKNSSCANVLNPDVLGYKKTATHDAFALDMDVGTAFAGMSVNIDLISVRELKIAYVLIDSMMYNGVEYQVDVMMNKDFPLQSNLYCLGPKASLANNSSNDWYCLMRFGDSYGLPFFQHYGTSNVHPTPCNCGDNGNHAKCNDFDFLIGAMLYDHSKNISHSWGYTYQKDQYSKRERPFLPFLEYLFGGPLNPPRIIKDDDYEIFYPAWLGTTSAEIGVNNQTYNQTYREKIYNFSRTSFGTATFFSFHAHTKYNRHSVNSRSYQVLNGSCADSFTSPGFDVLAIKPWAPLNEIYYQCTYKTTDAMTNGAGIAGGTVNTFLPLVVYLVMTLVMCPNILAGKSYKEENDIYQEELDHMFHPDMDSDKDKVHPVTATYDAPVAPRRLNMMEERSKSFRTFRTYKSVDSEELNDYKTNESIDNL